VLTPELFKQHLLECQGFLDPEGIHHQFVEGKHGRKLDFDRIPDGSDLFEEWVEINVRQIHKSYGRNKDIGKVVLLSVAEGTNRLVSPVASQLGDNVTAAYTTKESSRSVKLTPDGKYTLRSVRPDLVVALEDVSTSGTTSTSAVLAARQVGVEKVEVLNTWQRRPRLTKLEAMRISYHSIIKEELPTYTEKDCRRLGYCALGWVLIEHN